MKILIVFCHPRPDSFAAAAYRTIEVALLDAGHTVKVRDLYAEGFSPVLNAEEHRNYEQNTTPGADVQDHIAALRRADALILVYPSWWYGMPAILKGWFDRVWLPGVAFRIGDGAIEPLLCNIRRIAVVTTYGSPRWLLWFIGWPDRRLMGRGLRRLCSQRCKLDWLYLCSMDEANETDRKRFLDRLNRWFRQW